MLKGVDPRLYEFSDHHHHHGLECSAAAVDDEIFGSDEFRMYAYKVKRCPRTRSHDWTECPYAHRGEKAQRRDPRRHAYAAVVCPSFRTAAICERGESCEFAHGVFEYWLHPSRYRTRACNSGRLCQRKVCFFAHSPDQLRRGDPSSLKLKRGHAHYAYRARNTAATTADAAASSSSLSPSPSSSSSKTTVASSGSGSNIVDDDSFEKFSEFLKSLRALKIGYDDDDDDDLRRERDDEIRPVMMMMMSSGFDVSTESDLDLTHNVEWISELVK